MTIKYPAQESPEDSAIITPEMELPGYMIGQLREVLERCKQRNKEDWDSVIIVDGEERGGKSRMASQVAKYLYPDLSINDYAFNPEQFMEKIEKAKPHTAIVYDEAYGGFNSPATMTIVNRTLVQKMTEIGYKNLFVLIVLPSIFDLTAYIPLHRAKMLIHVYVSKKKWRRGFFWAMNKESLRDLYIYGKKYRDYGVRKSDFSGTFGKWSGVDLDEYQKAKIAGVNGDGKL